ncbi:hypothetical protein ABG067_003711 [Albugo candida]
MDILKIRLSVLLSVNKLFSGALFYVHWMVAEYVPPEDRLLLIMTSKDIPENKNDENALYHLEKLPMERCLLSYQLHFDPSPIGRQILPGLPGHAEECILAYCSDAKACQKCLEPDMESAVKLSGLTIMGTIQVESTSGLENCITPSDVSACGRLEIIPRDICTRHSEMIKSKLQNMGIEYDMPSRSNLISYRSKMNDIILKRESNSQTHDRPFNSMVLFVLAEYKDSNCLLLFSLAHSVFFVSTEPRHIWMLFEDVASKSPYVQCLRITDKIFEHDIRSLRPISSKELIDHVQDRNTWMDLFGEGSDDWTPYSAMVREAYKFGEFGKLE